jgi:hypothetical protein
MKIRSARSYLTFSQLEGSRKKGKPKLRWLDDVLQDLKILSDSLVEEGTR